MKGTQDYQFSHSWEGKKYPQVKHFFKHSKYWIILLTANNVLDIYHSLVFYLSTSMTVTRIKKIFFHLIEVTTLILYICKFMKSKEKCLLIDSILLLFILFILLFWCSVVVTVLRETSEFENKVKRRILR